MALLNPLFLPTSKSFVFCWQDSNVDLFTTNNVLYVGAPLVLT